MEAYRRLNRRLQKYVDARVLCGTGSEAVRRSGLKRRDGRPIQRPEQLAWRLNRNPLVEAAYQERKAQAVDAWQDRVQRWLTELDRIATFDKRQLYNEQGNLRPIHELPEEVAAAIAGIEEENLFEGAGKDRKYIGRLRKIRTWSKPEAAKTLLQFVVNPPKRHELTGKDGAPIQYEDTRDRNLSAIEALSARLPRAAAGAPASPAEGGGDPEPEPGTES